MFVFLINEMSAKHSDRGHENETEKWQFEYKNLNDKYETLLKEREVPHWSLTSEQRTLWLWALMTVCCVCACVRVCVCVCARCRSWYVSETRSERRMSSWDVLRSSLRGLNRSYTLHLHTETQAPPSLTLNQSALSPCVCRFSERCFRSRRQPGGRDHAYRAQVSTSHS